ncbi:MAG: Stk1 family PASTA domain-containing Ser/Thr kinase [Lactobacillales bacterium]|nr:Stk1 family PASTA domain-containing Ser/Thr kinase [Lactobacillales bacterium]
MHPNIVQVYDVGEEANIQYLVMEYVKGMDLKKYIRQCSPLSNEDIVRIMCEILAGVATAHDHKIIHRDLKPQNILISEEGMVKITDFGIAIAVSETSLTQTNSMLGSVHYLSPEQARGNKATKMSDIYALGIILYEMMTGKVPFDGESAVTIALKHFQDELPSVREVNLNVPQSLENVALIATAKDPVNRYSSVLEMKCDLSTALFPSRHNEPKVLFSKLKTNETKVILPISPDAVKSKAATSQKQVDNQLLDKQIVNLYNKGKSPKKISNELLIPIEQVKKRLKMLARKRKVKYPRNNRKRYIWALSAVLLALGVIVFAIFSAPKDVIVPDLKNYTEKEARNKLLNLDLAVGKVIKVANPQIDQGNVVKTDPKEHTAVKLGRKLTLYLSDGAKKITLKDYAGKSFETAKEDLILKGYASKLIIQKKKDSDEVKEGRVISQSIDEGKKVNPEKDRIELVVSSGPKSIILEKYEDRYLSEVKEELMKFGLKESQIKVSYKAGTGKRAGIVIDVKPGEGMPVNKQTGKVTLYVSDGKIEIPKGLKGNLEENAKELLTDAGLDYEINREYSDSVPKGNIISVYPSAGSVDLGTKITLVISEGAKDAAANISSSSGINSQSVSSSSASD